MDDLIDMMVTNQSPADISDRIKEILMQKSAENIEIVRPIVAASLFGDEDADGETEVETDEEESEEDAE